MAAWRYEISLLVLKNISLVRCTHSWNIFQHSKRNFVSPSGHVISSIYDQCEKKREEVFENLPTSSVNFRHLSSTLMRLRQAVKIALSWSMFRIRNAVFFLITGSFTKITLLEVTQFFVLGTTTQSTEDHFAPKAKQTNDKRNQELVNIKYGRLLFNLKALKPEIAEKS